MEKYIDVESEMDKPSKLTGEMNEKALESVLGGANKAVIDDSYRQRIIGLRKDELTEEELLNIVGGANPKALAEKLGISDEELQSLLLSDDPKVIDDWISNTRIISKEEITELLESMKNGRGK